MVEFTEEQQKEIREMLAAAQNRQAFFEQAKGWFTASLSNSKYLMDGGQLLPETHEAGIAIYQQFIRDWTSPKAPVAPEKKDEPEPE
jgi:hypothetical protein